jgi:hypothetical protein
MARAVHAFLPGTGLGRELEPVKAVIDAITEADLPAVGRFMHDNLNPRVADDDWAKALRVPWQVASPNHGYLLRHNGQVVGAYLAYYSERTVAGEVRRICNLGAWCVLEEYRAEGIRLLRALLSQRGYEFTDLSPSGNVVALNQRLRFQSLDTSTALVPNLPRPAGVWRVVDDPTTVEALLSGSELDIYRDHRRAAAAHHLVTTDGTDHCYVIWRRDRRKGLPLFATILYVSDKAVFLRSSSAVTRRLAVRHGIPATLIEARVAGGRPGFSLALSASRPKMFKSARLAPQDIDYLYSELTCLNW